MASSVTGCPRTSRATPVTFVAPSATDIGAGYHFTCALLGTNEIACAGLADSRRLGFESGGSNVSTPALITPPGGGVDAGADGGDDGGAEAGAPALGATKISIGRTHSCALRAGGIATCWGSNGAGECGIAGGSMFPVDVPSLTSRHRHRRGRGTHLRGAPGRKRSLLGREQSRTDDRRRAGRAHPAHARPRRQDGEGRRRRRQSLVRAHDRRHGRSAGAAARPGSSATAFVRTRRRRSSVKNLSTTIKSITARSDRTCALLDDGSAYCWGKNRIGELGDGAVMTTGAAAPVVGY